jgi:hypothetical protein
MNGFPKYIATRRDVDNLIKTHPAQTRAWLKTMWLGRFVLQMNKDAKFDVKTAPADFHARQGIVKLMKNDKTGEVRFVENCEYDARHLGGFDEESMTVYGIDLVEDAQARIFQFGFDEKALKGKPYNVKL